MKKALELMTQLNDLNYEISERKKEREEMTAPFLTAWQRTFDIYTKPITIKENKKSDLIRRLELEHELLRQQIEITCAGETSCAELEKTADEIAKILVESA